MQRVSYLIVILGLAVASPSFAQSRPHMELVRGLRTNGLADLAMTYLDELKAGSPPPEVVIVLPLEYARTRLALAAMETDENRRNQILDTARAEFDTFIRSNPTHPQTPFANVDVARLNSLRGKTISSKTRWIQDAASRNKKIGEANKLFSMANDQFKGAIALIEKQTNKTSELESLEWSAKLDQAINLYDRAMTYADDSDGSVKRGEDLEAAQKILQKLIVLDREAVSWVARAWLAQVHFEMGDANTAKNEIDNILKQRNNRKAQAGVRVAQYFRILQKPERTEKKDNGQAQLQRTIDDASAWLSSYPSFKNTPEGLGALYMRATKRYELALLGVELDKNNKSKIASIRPYAVKLLNDAEKDFKELTETDNEYSEQSNNFRTRILVMIADQHERTETLRPETLGNFEKCYLESQVQYARMVQFSQKKPAPTSEQITAEQKKRYQSAIQFLEYALGHTTPSDPVREVFNAQLTLITYYYRQNLYPQAAILAEYVARTNPRAAKAPMVAGYAMECYGQAYSASKAKAGAAPEELDADLEHRRSLARYIISTWPDSPNADFSRHVLAEQFTRDQKFENALQLYQAIKPSYSNRVGVCLEMSGAMFKLVRPDETDPAQFNIKAKDAISRHQALWDRTINALQSLPAPTEEGLNAAIVEAKQRAESGKASPGSEEEVAAKYVSSYFSAQSNLALLYQLQGKTQEARKLGEGLLELIGKLTKLQGAARENHTFKAKTIVYRALKNECLDYSKQKNYAKVAETLDPLVAQMEKDFTEKKEGVDAPKDFRDAQRQVIVIALQSAVQDGKIMRAGELLTVLEHSGGSAEGNFGMMRSLAATIRSQLDLLRSELAKNPKDTGKKEEIENLSKGFTQFLDQIAPKADQIKDEAGKIEMKMFLAQGYSSVDSYAEATKLLNAVRDSLKTLQVPAAQKDSIERKKKQIDFALVHNYRLGRKYDDAEAIFKEIIGPSDPKKDKGSIPPNLRGWGYAVPTVRKERALLKEEMALSWTKKSPSKAEKWGEAIAEWTEIKKTFANNIPPRLDEKGVLKSLQFMFVGGGGIGDTNPINITLRDKVRAQLEENARKRATFFDIYLDQAACLLKAYHTLDPVKYDPQIGKVALNMTEFHVKNPDLGPEYLERIKTLLDEYPKTLKPKYVQAQAEWKAKSK